jgi:Peroxidase
LLSNPKSKAPPLRVLAQLALRCCRAQACMEVRAGLKRTSEVSLADVIAFGGGEALEAVGGPRAVVQLGRYDERKSANPAEPIAGYRCGMHERFSLTLCKYTGMSWWAACDSVAGAVL